VVGGGGLLVGIFEGRGRGVITGRKSQESDKSLETKESEGKERKRKEVIKRV
jgi:hypothetical protein